MTEERNRQLEAKIQERLERLKINLPDLKGYFYLSELLYVLISDDTVVDIERAEEKVAKDKEITLYELKQEIQSILVLADEKSLKTFYKAENYNLAILYQMIELIADDIVMDD